MAKTPVASQPPRRRSPSITQIRRDLESHARMISELVTYETRRQDQAKAASELEEFKEEALDGRLKRIEASVAAVYSLGKWILASIGATLLLAIVTFILRGGLFVGVS